MKNEPIRKINLAKTDLSQFSAEFTGCIILSKDNKLILQKRGSNWSSHPDKISTFGGRVESGERPIDAMIRELGEELEAVLKEADLISLGVVTEAITQYSELVYLYFWHDEFGSIGRCHEGEIITFESVASALKHQNVMDDVKWALTVAETKQLI